MWAPSSIRLSILGRCGPVALFAGKRSVCVCARVRACVFLASQTVGL